MNKEQIAILDDASQLVFLASSILIRSKAHLNNILAITGNATVNSEKIIAAIKSVSNRLNATLSEPRSHLILNQLKETKIAAQQAVRDVVSSNLQVIALIGKKCGRPWPVSFTLPPGEEQATMLELEDYLRLVGEQIDYLIGSKNHTEITTLGPFINSIYQRIEIARASAARNVEVALEALAAIELLHLQIAKFIRAAEQAEFE